jgi:hypothetical protein
MVNILVYFESPYSVKFEMWSTVIKFPPYKYTKGYMVLIFKNIKCYEAVSWGVKSTI